MMFGTWLHINIPRNNQYKWVYISKSGICLVIFLPWHSFYKHWNLKTQSSQIDFKLFLASSSPCPWACVRLCNKKRPLMSISCWQQLAIRSKIPLSLFFHFASPGVLWPYLLFSLEDKVKAVQMLLFLWRTWPIHF